MACVLVEIDVLTTRETCVLTWGVGGGEGEGEFVAVGYEVLLFDSQVFDGRAYVHLVSLGCGNQLGLLRANIDDDGVNLPLQVVELFLHLGSFEAESV